MPARIAAVFIAIDVQYNKQIAREADDKLSRLSTIIMPEGLTHIRSDCLSITCDKYLFVAGLMDTIKVITRFY